MRFAAPYRQDPRGLPRRDRRRCPHRSVEPADLPRDHRQRHRQARLPPDRHARPAPRGPGARRRRAVARPALHLGPRRRGTDLRHARQGLRATSSEMPLAFFTRTQTGALISRLNNDVIGAQQAFTDTLSSVVGNLITVVLTVAVMLFLSWQITLVASLLLPLFVFPARWVGRKLQLAHQGGLQPQRRDEQHHERALQRGRRPAGQAVRPPGRGARSVRRPAARVRDIGVHTAMYGRSSSCRSSSPRRWPRRSSTAGAACSPWTARFRSARSSPCAALSPGSTARSPRCRTSTSTS